MAEFRAKCKVQFNGRLFRPGETIHLDGPTPPHFERIGGREGLSPELAKIKVRRPGPPRTKKRTRKVEK